MKKIKLLAGCLMAIILLMCLSGCGEEKKSYLLYFGNAEKTTLSEEVYFANATEDIPPVQEAKAVLELLLAGPKNPEHTRVIPEGTKVLDVMQNGKLLTVDFSEAFDDIKRPEKGVATDRILACCSVAKTLTEIEGIEKVQILVEGDSIISSVTGETIAAIGAGDVALYLGGSDTDDAVLTLYFIDPSTHLLVKEARPVTIKENTVPVRTVVAELLKGPQNKALTNGIPSDTALLSVEVKEGVCFVNFDKTFKDKYSESSETEKLTVYSIVDSLTEIPEVQSVQILIAGEKADTLKTVPISEPLTRDETLIKGQK